MNKKKDYATCVTEANGFLEVAQWCIKDDFDMPEKLKYPFVVNISFACELFIKAILIFNDIEYGKIHDLKDLFCRLDSAVQQKIRQLYEDSNCNYRVTFDEFLNNCSKDFVRWRYAYENNNLEANASNYLNFASQLKGYVNSLGVEKQ